LIIDSDKHQNKEEKQNQRAADFEKDKLKNKSYVISRSCIENYYHPRAIEREYELIPNTFDFIKPEDNARNYIKGVIAEKALSNKNIKEKNNFKIFEQMTEVEWKELIEKELCDFLKEIIN
jgi:hypothetical protein